MSGEPAVDRGRLRRIRVALLAASLATFALLYAPQPVLPQLAARLARSDRPFVDNDEAPPDEAARGQLLRAMSSDAIRGALERHFNVVLAFQNCHRVAVFPPRARTSPEYRDFTSVESQVLNQRPGLVNC